MSTIKALRLYISPAPGTHGNPRGYVVRVGETPPHLGRPLTKAKWCDLEAGDRIELDGRDWTIGNVWLEETEPPGPFYREVISGRHWIRTGYEVPMPRPSSAR